MSRPQSTEARARSLIGRVLSERYRLDAIVAMGSMGAVYRAYHLKMRKEVAIKILHPETEGFPDLVARFEREAIVGAHITHPNIALASDMGTFDDGSYFLVLELVKGRTLRQIVDDEGPVKPGRAVRLIRQLVSALGAAHARGVVHRDLKLLNVMVTADADETVKLIDFGLARVPVEEIAPSEDAQHTRSVSSPGIVFGTVATMAPEITLGMDAIDERSDLYSVGVIFYELLLGKHPFELGEPSEVLLQHRDAAVPAMAARNPGVHVPPAIEAVVMRLLEKRPQDRYRDVPALLEALDAGSPGLFEASSPRAFATPHTAASTERRRLAGYGVIAVVGLGVVLLAFGALKSERDPAGTGANDGHSQTKPSDLEPASQPSSQPSADLAGSLRSDLLQAAEGTDDAEAGAILIALADADKTALKDAALRAAAVKIATRIGERGGDGAAQAYYALSYRFGSAGLDVLYDVSMQEQSAKARGRAQAILDVQAKTDRPSPALRVVLELKAAKCRQKPLLFGRVSADGDARAIDVLEKLRPPSCEPEGETCCFRRHLGLEKTILTLRERAGSKP